jgi:hypothetical protein
VPLLADGREAAAIFPKNIIASPSNAPFGAVFDKIAEIFLDVAKRGVLSDLISLADATTGAPLDKQFLYQDAWMSVVNARSANSKSIKSGPSRCAPTATDVKSCTIVLSCGAQQFS